jgi:hypothetical protein
LRHSCVAVYPNSAVAALPSITNAPPDGNHPLPIYRRLLRLHLHNTYACTFLARTKRTDDTLDGRRQVDSSFVSLRCRRLSFVGSGVAFLQVSGPAGTQLRAHTKQHQRRFAFLPRQAERTDFVDQINQVVPINVFDLDRTNEIHKAMLS